MVKDRIPMTREDVVSVVCPTVEDSVVLNIIVTGSSLEDLQGPSHGFRLMTP
jgi:hypothetical protein